MAIDNKKNDALNGAPLSLKDRVKKNPVISAIVGAIVLIAVIFLCVHLYGKYEATQNEEAATKLAKGQQYFGMGQFDQALNGDNAGYQGLLKIASQYSGTETGNLANLYAGLAYFYKADYDNAIKFLEKFDPKDDSMISNNAIAALGNCYAKKGNLDKAVSLLKKAAKRASNPVISPYCLIQAGEILESQDNKDEALKLYKEVQEKYPSSGEAQTIQKYIDRVSM